MECSSRVGKDFAKSLLMKIRLQTAGLGHDQWGLNRIAHNFQPLALILCAGSSRNDRHRKADCAAGSGGFSRSALSIRRRRETLAKSE